MNGGCGPRTSLSSFSTFVVKIPLSPPPNISHSSHPPSLSITILQDHQIHGATRTYNMSTHNSSINYSIKEEATEGGEYTMENDNILLNATGDQDEKKKRASSDHVGGSVKKGGASNGGGGASSMRCCQAEKCTADLTDAKQYHRRHKVCEEHAKAQMVVVAGIRQRFCQQCSRFHELSEFDEAKRSCRRRLAGHNERRRKTQVDHSHAEGSNRKGTCGQVDDRGRIQISIQENATYKTFQDQIRSR